MVYKEANSKKNLKEKSETDLVYEFKGNNATNYHLHTGIYPMNIIHNKDNVLEGYPKLQRLVDLKENAVAQNACPAFGFNCATYLLSDIIMNWASNGIKFDVLMIGSCLKNSVSVSSLMGLPIQNIVGKPSFLFLWVSSEELEIGRQLLTSWGFRRSEDIVYLVRSADSLHSPPPPNPKSFFKKTAWHCLMGIKGTVRRCVDSNIIHCNIDTDVIMEKEIETSIVPDGIYKIIENFSLSNRRLHIIPFHSDILKPIPRRGWVLIGPDVNLKNFSIEKYKQYISFAKQYLSYNDEIDNLRPKSPTGKYNS